MASIVPELAYELPPFVKVYKDGKIERLMGTDIIPPGTHPETGVQSKDVVILPETGVSARLYKPKQTNQNQKIPLVFYFHGGGFYVQTPFSSTYQPFLNALVADSNIIIVSVDYRRAPEHPLPIGYDDCWASIKWVASHSNGGGPEVCKKNIQYKNHNDNILSHIYAITEKLYIQFPLYFIFPREG